MDELRTIREAYGEPAPPTLREMTEIRARVLGEPESPRRRARFGWRFKAGAGLVAAGAAAAVAVAAVGSGSPASPSTVSPPVDLGKQAVLAAADRAAAQSTGKYWYSDEVSGVSYIVQPKSGTPYAIVGAHTESFSWHGARAGMGEKWYERGLPARPLTAQDEKLWREAGSPSSFRVQSDGRTATYTTRATGWRSDVPNTGLDPKGGGRFGLGLSAQELRTLPTDQAELTTMFLDEKSGSEQARQLQMVAKVNPGALPNFKLRAVGALLNSPTQPKVRAALIRALTAQPGIHAIGEVTDPLGRRGVALAADPAPFLGDEGDRAQYASRNVMVFDKQSGTLLAYQRVLTTPGGEYRTRKPGFVIDFSAFRSTGWTDAKPEPPAELPF